MTGKQDDAGALWLPDWDASYAQNTGHHRKYDLRLVVALGVHAIGQPPWSGGEPLPRPSGVRTPNGVPPGPQRAYFATPTGAGNVIRLEPARSDGKGSG
jgi:hypothetical protein